MGQLMSTPEVPVERPRRNPLRRLSRSVQRRFKRTHSPQPVAIQQRPAPRQPPPPVPLTPPGQPEGLDFTINEVPPHYQRPLTPPAREYTPSPRTISPQMSQMSENSLPESTESPQSDNVYPLLVSRLLAIAASMTAAILIPTIAFRGELYGGANHRGDTSFLGYIDALLSGRQNSEIAQVLSAAPDGRAYFRMFRFPRDESNNVPVLVIGVRSGELIDEDENDSDNDSQYYEGLNATVHEDHNDSLRWTDNLEIPRLPLRRTVSRTSTTESAGHSPSVISVVAANFPESHYIFQLQSLRTANPSNRDIIELERLLKPDEHQTASRKQMGKAGGLSEVTEALDNEKCAICLENYVPGEVMRSLACTHSYHKDCVDRWLTGSHNSCPICRSVGVH